MNPSREDLHKQIMNACGCIGADMRTLEAIEAKEQLIRTLKTACEIAWYICTIAEKGTKDHELSCQIKYCIELALRLLGQKRYTQRQALKHLVKDNKEVTI